MKQKYLLSFCFGFLLAIHSWADSNALSFDGNDYVRCGAINPTTFSISVWVNPAVVNKDQAIISTLTESGNAGYELHIGSDGIPVVTVSNGVSWVDVKGATAISAETWTHLAATYNGSSVAVFINGIKQATSNVSAVQGSADLLMGRRSVTSASDGYAYTGVIDEIGIWQSALSDTYINSIMNWGVVNLASANIVYTFNQGTAEGDNTSITTLTDEYGNYNGTLYGFALTGSASNFVEGYNSAVNIGSEINPFKIGSLFDLKMISTNSTYWASGYYFEQIADIDASGTKSWNSGSGFSPIGNSTTNFSAYYNGAGYTIDGLYINQATDYMGLFGYVSSGTIKNLEMTNFYVNGSSNVGGLVGYCYYGTITNCHTNGTVHGNWFRTGGLVGNSYHGAVSNCYAMGNISGYGHVGGLAGYNSYSATLDNCYSIATVSGNYNVGGLVGGTIFSGTINNCYSTGSVSGTSFCVGGLVGENYVGCKVTNCYATGKVSGSTKVGGLVGSNSAGTVSYSYYNKETSGQTDLYSTGLTTAEMKQAASFSGWDFTDTWGIRADSIYPALRTVSNNAPFAIPDSVLMSGSSCNINPMANDYDYEKIKTGLVYHIDNLPYNGTLTLTSMNYSGFSPKDSLYYTVGEVISAGDTLWGNQAKIVLVFPYGLNGSGTESNPFKISSLDDLKSLSEYSGYWTGSYYFEQTADINAGNTKNWNTNQGFSPIGSSTLNFNGHYNGAGYVIDSLYINRTTDCDGLFGCIGSGTVTNLGVINVSISGASLVGAIAGSNYAGTVTNCYATGSISAVNYVGGIVGNNGNSMVSGCYTVLTITGANYVGGIAGQNTSYSTVSNCYSTGSVSASTHVGGIVGLNFGYGSTSTVSNCYATGTASGTTYVGCVVGYNYYGFVSSCYFDNQTSGMTSGIGLDNYSQSATALTTSAMKQSANFSGWDFTNTWGILADSIYPALRTVSNNAPFAFADRVDIKKSCKLDTILLTNDYDYETIQTNLIFRITVQPGIGTISDGKYIFNDGAETGDKDSVYYRVGEVVSEGDTLWGNQAKEVFTNVPFEGEGTETSPYLISSLEDLRNLSENTAYWTGSYYFKQTVDINAADTKNWNSGAGFSPIGNNSINFFGYYHGGGFTIDSLYINRSATYYIGLFGYTSGVTIDSLGLTNGNITGKFYVGGIVGYNGYSSTISNCYTTGSVTGSSGDVGGIAGFNISSTISNCYNTGSVTGSYDHVGGIAGINPSSTISNCYNTGSVTGSSKDVGGIAGYSVSSAKISNCYNTGLVTGSSNRVGGIAGYNSSSTISNCYNAGPVSGSSDVGGFVGNNLSSTISNCYYNSETSGYSDSYATGLTTAQMKQAANFSGWDYTDIWGIRTDSTYPALQRVNNAPFAFVDSLSSSKTINISGVLANDYDYETLQAELANKVISNTAHFGSISGGVYTFNTGLTTGDADTIVYRVGEVIAVGDTLWGNQATSYLIYQESSVPTDLTVSDTTVTAGTETCFDAENEITVAGSSSVTVEEDAAASFIAGSSIRFLPGFHAVAGSYVSAKITTDGSFCDNVNSSVVAVAPVEEKSLFISDISENKNSLVPCALRLKIYPNPNQGNFTIELTNIASQVNLTVFDIMGKMVYQANTRDEVFPIYLPSCKKGIYVVRATEGSEQSTKKIIIE